MNDRSLQVLKHIIGDMLAAASAWTCFYVFRKVRIESIKFGQEVPIQFDSKFFFGLSLILFFWFVLYAPVDA